MLTPTYLFLMVLEGRESLCADVFPAGWCVLKPGLWMQARAGAFRETPLRSLPHHGQFAAKGLGDFADS